jgi:cytidine deaminase
MDKKLEQALITGAQTGVTHALTKNLSGDDMRFGAAVLTTAGNIYAAGQYYSDTASLTLHAEQAALAHAAAHGEYNIVAIAIAWNEAADGGDDSVYPCHMCKQLLWESHLRSGQEIEILIVNKGAILERLVLSKIMSHTWPK